MDSFYGGKQGFSFIIVKNFSSVAEMVRCFKQGPSYSAVNFDEHVLIDTVNKNDPENGRVYRRGYEYSNDMGGAIYIGTIVGPAGHAPRLELTTVEEVLNKGTDDFDVRKGEGSYTAVDGNLVPGKNADGSFNDEIEWAYCSVRDGNNVDTTAYIGFKIPYTVIDFTAQSVSPYYNRNSALQGFTNLNLSQRTDDKAHPFYEKWHFNIPKGIKGDTLKNFRVIKPTIDDNIKDLNGNDYAGKADDVSGKRSILVYDYYHYDAQEGGEPVSIYLGDYNMISGINISDEGTFTVDYTHNDSYVRNKLMKWINNITLNTETGLFEITYNQTENGQPLKYSAYLSWVKNIVLAEDGTVTLKFTHGSDKVLDPKIKWIASTTVEDDGTLVINYNTGGSQVFSKRIKWVHSISLSQSGVFNVVFNNNSEGGQQNYTTQLIWVSDIDIDNDGTIKIFSNDDVNKTRPKQYDKYLKVIKNIYIETEKAGTTGGEGSGDQMVHVVYNTGEEAILGKPLNYIIDMNITEDYHLVVKYSDPERRANLGSDAYNGYDGGDEWLDLGSVKSENGILIGKNIEDESLISSISDAINYLNSTYPNGLVGTDLKGKIVSIGAGNGDKKFYAFDYTFLPDTQSYKGWFYLGELTINASSIMMVGNLNKNIGVNDDANISATVKEQKEKISVGGLWFINRV